MNLTRILYDYFDRHGRDLPWRHTHDPYAILVSEVMLQQTQVPRVIEKYLAWMHRFPTVLSVAETDLAEVLRYWIGLGYNRRAKYLFDLAQEVVCTYSGQLPADRQLLLKLPGIGQYTAAAVCVFAYNQPLPLIETNVRTVLIHHFFPNQTSVSDKQLLPLIEKNLDTANPRKWYSAIMDYGTYLKTSVGNLSRKSKHYNKQSSFQGSLRQMRGYIIQSLINHQPIPRNSTTEAAITSLQRDGLIKITRDGEISLAQS